jgi:hypothetical protein
MPTYRDGDPRLRIDTLQAKLAERDASLAARDTELTELRAEITRARGGDPAPPARRLSSLLVVGAMLTSTVIGASYVGMRLEIARVRAAAQAQEAMLRAERARLEARIEDTHDKLVDCARHAEAPSLPPPPSAYFGDETDRRAIDKALEDAARDAAKCGIPDGPTGTGRVRLIFDALQGKVDSASIEGAPFAGSAVESCVLAPFRRVHVSAFKAPRVTLTKSFTIK